MAITDASSATLAPVDLGAGAVEHRGSGLRPGRELHELRREPEIAGRGQLGRARGERVSAAREARDLRGERGRRCRLEMARIPVVPAAEQPPDVAHHELGLVVDRTQVGTVQQSVRRPHGGDDLVEGRPFVHHADRLVVEVLQQRRRLGQREPDPVGAHDGEPVAGEQDLGVELGHLAERVRPLDGIALHLLGIAAVRRRPDEEVARAEDPAGRDPDPDVVVGLAAGVVALDRLATDGQVDAVAEGVVRVTELAGERRSRQLELALVDDPVVTGRLAVAVEPCGDRLVGQDPRRPPAMIAGLLLVELDAEAVVGVAVGEHGRVEAELAPALDRVVDRRRGEPAAGVGEDETVVGRDHRDVGERGHERGVGRDVGQLTVPGEQAPRGGLHLSREHAVGEVEQVGHGPILAATR